MGMGSSKSRWEHIEIRGWEVGRRGGRRTPRREQPVILCRSPPARRFSAPMGWAHVSAVVGVLLLGSIAVAGNAPVILAKLGDARGGSVLVSAAPCLPRATPRVLPAVVLLRPRARAVERTEASTPAAALTPKA
jgi:hypothetical protein